jgi:signal transduction histidine kinase
MWIPRRQRRGSGRGTQPDAPLIRRTGWQLAALTVGLLSVLLLLLGGAVYLTTQQLLEGTLRHTLQARAARPPSFLLAAIQADVAVPTGGQSSHFSDPNGVFFTVFDRRLTVLGGTGPFSPPLSERAQAQAALHGDAVCCDLQRYQGQDYLVASEAVATTDGRVIGVVQASISAGQYESSLQSLLHVLLAVTTVGLAAAAVISAMLVRRALRPIQRAWRRQRDFVADAAHELRTPLAIMRTAAELGLAHEAQVEQQRALERTLEQNAHLTRLVDSLSLLARADSGAVMLERQPMDLSRLVREVASGVAVLAEERGVALLVEAGPESRVLGDSGRLRQLVLILLDNALKHTPAGGGVRVAVDRQSDAIRLVVRDTGPGIAPDDLPHLFERFYRADRARTGEGTGLGLAIGRWIAEAHGGYIAAANARAQGALFTVTLPAAM